jgi:hypothetical protein
MHKTVTGHLYVLEVTGGLVKVGFSTAPKARLKQHARDTRKKALAIIREWVSPKHVEAGRNEEKLIASCGRLGGTDCGMGREWFSGVHFDDVVAAATGLDCTAPENGTTVETVRYPLTWPAWMCERVTEAANARAMSVAVWIREAVREKLERTEKER